MDENSPFYCTSLLSSYHFLDYPVMKDQLIAAFNEFADKIIRNTPDITVGIILMLLFLFIGSAAQSLIRKRMLRKIEDRLLVNFAGRIVFMIMAIIGIVIFLNQIGLGKAASGLLAGAGVSTLILGFAFKDLGENFLAGFFLAFSRPFGTGDVIEVEGLKGIVKMLNFRNTHIRSFDGRDIFLPNAMLIKNPLQNYTKDGLLRYNFVVGLDFGDDVAKAGRVIMETLMANRSIEKENELKPFLQLEEFGTSTINLGIYYWINNANFLGDIAFLKTEVMTEVLRALVSNGFTLPADIVELKIYQEGSPIPLKMTDNTLAN